MLKTNVIYNNVCHDTHNQYNNNTISYQGDTGKYQTQENLYHSYYLR